MIRNLKTLSLALVALLALSAMATSAAQADKPARETAEKYPVKYDSKLIKPMVMKRQGREITCETVTLEGENDETEHDSITFNATYGGCHSILLGTKMPVTFTMNGCEYEDKLTADIIKHKDGKETHTYTAVTDVKCPAGQQIEIHVYANATAHAEGKTTCKYKVGEAGNTGLGITDITNEPAGGTTPKDWLKVHIKLAKLVSSAEGSPLICGSAHDTEGTMDGEGEIKGTDKDGKPNGITVSTKMA
jgi:hypothetical protein